MSRVECERMSRVECEPTSRVECERTSRVECERTSRVECERTSRVECERTSRVEREWMSQVVYKMAKNHKYFFSVSVDSRVVKPRRHNTSTLTARRVADHWITIASHAHFGTNLQTWNNHSINKCSYFIFHSIATVLIHIFYSITTVLIHIFYSITTVLIHISWFTSESYSTFSWISFGFRCAGNVIRSTTLLQTQNKQDWILQAKQYISTDIRIILTSTEYPN